MMKALAALLALLVVLTALGTLLAVKGTSGPAQCLKGVVLFQTLEEVRGLSGQPMRQVFVGEQYICARGWEFSSAHGPSIEAYLEAGGVLVGAPSGVEFEER